MIKAGLVLSKFGGNMLGAVRDVRIGLVEARRRAVNNVVRQAPEHLRQRMRQVFDRPTPYALNAFRVNFAGRGEVAGATGTLGLLRNAFGSGFTGSAGDAAAVMIKGPQDATGNVPQQSVLRAQILGGRRRHKQSERSLRASGLLPAGWYTVPGRSARLDTYGNVSRGEILRILAYLKALVATRQGGRARKTALTDKRRERLRAGTRNRIGFRMFVVPVGQRGGLKPGVYEEQQASRRFVGPAARPRQLLAFTRQVQYRRRFNFWGELQQHAAQTMPRELDREVARLTSRLGRAR